MIHFNVSCVPIELLQMILMVQYIYSFIFFHLFHFLLFQFINVANQAHILISLHFCDTLLFIHFICDSNKKNVDWARFIEKLRCYSADSDTHAEMTHGTNLVACSQTQTNIHTASERGTVPLFFICVCSQNFQVQTGMTSNCQAARQPVLTQAPTTWILWRNMILIEKNEIIILILSV